MNNLEEKQIRDYAAMRISWSQLRRQGRDYSWLLTGLGALGLRPPITDSASPAVERGRQWLREALAHPGPQ